MNLPSPDRKSKEEEEPLRKSPKKSVVSLRRVIDSPNENFATEKKEEVIEKDSGSEQGGFSIFFIDEFFFQGTNRGALSRPPQTRYSPKLFLRA